MRDSSPSMPPGAEPGADGLRADAGAPTSPGAGPSAAGEAPDAGHLEPAGSALAEAPGEHGASPPPVRVTRAGRAWVTIVVGIVVLALLLVFIFQNLHDTTIHFFTVRGSLPVALALIIAAIAGAAVVLLVGSVRIIQLRRHVRASYQAGAAHALGSSDRRSPPTVSPPPTEAPPG